MAELKEDKLVQVANESLDVVHRFYRLKGEVSDNAVSKVKIAGAMFGAFVKYRQHQSNMSAVRVTAANTIFENPKEREAYLRLSDQQLKLKEYRESKLLEAGLSPELVEPKEFTTDEQGYIKAAQKQIH